MQLIFAASFLASIYFNFVFKGFVFAGWHYWWKEVGQKSPAGMEYSRKESTRCLILYH
jgi:hypothetical protein